MLQHYLANRYAPRCHSLYVASLYSDPHADSDGPIEAEAVESGEDRSCACGSLDPLHVWDASLGLMARDSAARKFSLHSPLRDELDHHSCDAHKQSAVAPPHTCEVDALTSDSGPAIRRPFFARPAGGQDRHLPFGLWLADKQAQLLEREAADKAAALAELASTVARREQAVRQFEQWKARKRVERAEEAAAEAERRAQADAQLTPRRAETQQAERARAFEAWSSAKRRERSRETQRTQLQQSLESEQQLKERSDRLQRSASTYADWKRTRVRSLTRQRMKRQAEESEKQTAEAAERAKRQARAADQYAAWNSDKEKEIRRATAEEARAAAEKQAAEVRRAADVERTRAEREQRLAAHFRALTRERLESVSEEARIEQQRHRDNWQKKATPLAYSTQEPTRRVFR